MNASWDEVAFLPGMSDAIFHRLRAAYARAEALEYSDTERIAEVARVPREAAAALVGDAAWRAARETLAAARARGGWAVTAADARYPAPLLEATPAPRVLSVRGALDDPAEARVAIVGSRATDARSRDVAYGLASGLAARGYTIVSGLARGVDTAAHEGALDAGGRTIAVLGSGIDRVYPEENDRLAERIVAQGALVSQFPPGTEPLRQNFPSRNLTIAGLSRGVIVVQAPVKSGALITAQLALHANREVFAVPGPVGEARYAGSNRLLRDGAHVCLDMGDVIAEFEGPAAALEFWALAEGRARAARPGRGRVARAERGDGAAGSDTRAAERDAAGAGPRRAALPPDEARVFECVSTDPMHVDELARAAAIPLPDLLAALLNLELRGAVHALPGKLYARRATLP